VPDIALCTSTACPSRSSCHRNKASGTEPSNWQWYADFDAQRAGSDRCDSYWPKTAEAYAAPTPAITERFHA
jgi:hypothetical protein